MTIHPTTRRRLLTAATGVATAAALPAIAKSTPCPNWMARREFVKQIANLHPNGARVAIRALECGAEPELLKCVQLHNPSRPDRAGMPVLYFDVRGKPGQQIVVSMRGGYLHGPVL